MPNPLDFLLRDPNAMRYELMRDQANLKKGGKVGGKAMGGTLTQPNPVPTQQRTPPGGAMRNISWAQYREAIGLKQGGAQNYAGGGKVYSGQLPDSPSVDKAEESKLTPRELSFLEALYGAGETGMSMFINSLAAPTAGLTGAAGELLGLGSGEDIANRAGLALTTAPKSETGQRVSEYVKELMDKSGLSSLPPVVSGINPAALRVMPGTGRYVGQQAIETARPLHEAYMAGEVPGVPAPASYMVKPETGAIRRFKELVRREAPAQFEPITEALRQTAQTGLEHSVVGNTQGRGASTVTRGTKDSITPNMLSLRNAIKSSDIADIIDFHTHPTHEATFSVAPSRQDFDFYSNEYPRLKDKELRSLIATPVERAEYGFGPRPTTAYNFFATQDPSIMTPRSISDLRGELQLAARKGAFDEVRRDPRFSEYFLNNADIGDVLGEASSLLLQRYRAQQGRGRHELQLSGAPVDVNPEATNSALFELLVAPSIKTLESKKFAEGGTVKTPTIAFPQNMNYNVDDMRYALARRQG